MFGSGFGAESEARDAQRHSTGRRHGPREMTNELGMPHTATDNTVLAQKNFENRRAVQQQNMEKAPSFMEQMYSHDASRGQGNGGKPPHAAQGLKKGNGKDQLNLFSWDNRDAGSEVVATKRGVVERSDAELRSLRQKDDAVKRDGDAKKFEKSKDGNFLRFSENNPQPARKPLSPQSKPVPYAVDYPQRDVPEKDGNSRPMRRRAPPPKEGDGSEFEGFPGMGRACPQKNGEHIERRGQESNIFPPSATPSAAGAYDPEMIQRVHQHRTKPEVGVATQSTQVPRNLGPYTTSNDSYGINKTSAGRVVSDGMDPAYGAMPAPGGRGAPDNMYAPGGPVSPQSYGYGYSGQSTPQAVPQGYSYSGQETPQMGYGGESPSSAAMMAAMMAQQRGGGGGGEYQPPRLAPGARPAPHEDDCACCPPSQKARPSSESSTPRFIRDHDEYGAGDEDDLYAYEQQLRARLMRAREAEGGEGGRMPQNRADPVSYEFSSSKGFVETPRDGAARWMDDNSSAVTPSAMSEAPAEGDRRVRFNM